MKTKFEFLHHFHLILLLIWVKIQLIHPVKTNPQLLKAEEFKSQPVIFYFFFFSHLPNPILYQVPSVPPSNPIPSLATSDQPSHLHPSPVPTISFAWKAAIISCSVFPLPCVPSRVHSPHIGQRDDFRNQFCQSHSYLKLCFSIELNQIPYDLEGNT